MPKPSTIRLIHAEQDVYALLWRIMPKAMKDYKADIKKQLHVKMHQTTSFQVTVK
jgi:hypothetical protein